MKRSFLFITIVMMFLTACGLGKPMVFPSDAPSSSPTSLPNPTVIPTAQPDMLYVDPTRELGPISPYVYGSNYGPWTAVPVGMMDQALNSRISALRFPGGSWGDHNDVQEFQIDMFMAFCKQVGAMPTFTVRLLGGTPEAAAEMVRYTNIEKKYGVVYWAIGNEPDLYYKLAASSDYDTVRYNQEWRAFAKAMRVVDPSIKLIGPEISNFTGIPNHAFHALDIHGKDWMSEFLKSNGEMVDVVSFHRYPFPKVEYSSVQATVDELRQDSQIWVQAVRELRKLIQDTTGRDIPIAITEANSASTNVIQGEATPDSFYNAIWWADVLGGLINENVLMVNYWVLTTASGETQSGLGLIALGKVRPTYYVYQMYGRFGTERVYAASGIKDVSVYAAKQADGSVTIMVINLMNSEQRVPLQVRDTPLSKAETWLFDKAHEAEGLGELSFPSDGRLDLPAQSISLYELAK